MHDTLVYVLTNETTGIASSHDSLNGALDAVIDKVGNCDEWVIELWSRGRPLRWVAEGRGHTRAEDDVPGRVAPEIVRERKPAVLGHERIAPVGHGHRIGRRRARHQNTHAQYTFHATRFLKPRRYPTSVSLTSRACRSSGDMGGRAGCHAGSRARSGQSGFKIAERPSATAALRGPL